MLNTRTAPEETSRNCRILCIVHTRAEEATEPERGTKANCEAENFDTAEGKIILRRTIPSSSLERSGSREIGQQRSDRIGLGALRIRRNICDGTDPFLKLRLKIAAAAESMKSAQMRRTQAGISSGPGDVTCREKNEADD